MTEKIKTVPELRFPGFAKEWKESPLGELLSFKNGYNAEKVQYGNGIKFINVLDIIQNDFITYDRIIGSVEIPAKDFQKNEVKYGDILFQRSSETREEVGQTNVYLDREKSATFGGFVIRGRPLTNFDSVFLNLMLKTSKARRDITSRSGGSTRYNIGQESLEDALVSVAPTVPEQQKIADFLTAVDGRIAQLSRKKALLEDYKKGVMQQLFTQVLRFKNDDGSEFPDWEKKPLGKLGTFKSGVGFSESEQGGVSGIPFYKVSDMNLSGNESEMLSANHYVTSEQVSRNGYKVIKEPAIIFAKVGAALFLERKRVSQGFLIDNNMMAFIPSFSITFAKHLFTTIRLSKFAQIGALPSYNAADLATIQVSIPCAQEQTKIAHFLTALDRKIESVAAQITHTQIWKKGLLQQMFV